MSDISEYTVRPIEPAEWEKFHFIWEISQDTDDPAGRPTQGWWHLGDWADEGLVLLEGSMAMGLAALKPASDRAAIEVRLAFLPQYRQPQAVARLIEAVFEKSQQDSFGSARFFISGGGTWATGAIASYGIELFRAYHAMLLPAAIEVPDVPVPEGVRIRPMADGEDETVLAALNRAWATTWEFRPVPMSALQADLVGQRAGFLVAVPSTGETKVVGTCHAIFDPTNSNPDSGLFAKISNLTNDPDWRGRGLGRALLTAGIHLLRERGATSVTLGVDGGNPVPMALYGSMGFKSISRLEVWTGKVPELR